MRVRGREPAKDVIRKELVKDEEVDGRKLKVERRKMREESPHTPATGAEN
jgi:hypothetical protein